MSLIYVSVLGSRGFRDSTYGDMSGAMFSYKSQAGYGEGSSAHVVLAGGFTLLLAWDRGGVGGDMIMTYSLAWHHHVHRTLGPYAWSSGTLAP